MEIVKGLSQKANVTQEDLIVPTFLNNWVAHTAPIGYYKDTLGFVHLQGAVSSGTTTTSIFVLPVGYRPVNTRRFINYDDVGPGRVNIEATGDVNNPGGAVTWVSLDGISFYAGR